MVSEAARITHPLPVLLCLGLMLSACGATPNTQGKDATLHGATPEGESPEIAQTQFALLTKTCSVSGAGISIAVDAGEIAVVAIDSVSGNVTVNANQASGAPCQAASNLGIHIIPGTVGDHGVYLDLSNGPFSAATSYGTPKIQINLGTGNNDTLTVRGTAFNDHFYLGKGTSPNTCLINLNGGQNTGDDTFVDVSVIGAEHVVVNGAAGDDIIDASGLFGTNAPYSAALSLFGGTGDDTLVGGAGDDLVSGDTGNDHLNGGKGSNTYPCSSINDGADVITVSATAIDTVDYSQRFNSVSAILDGSTTSGEAGENDSISEAVTTVLGGSGNDILSAAGSTHNHTLKGGQGNDTLIGGSGIDALDGGNGLSQVDGDDVFIGSKATVSYKGRTQPITVTVNSLGAGGVDANDGDLAVTRTVQATNVGAGATINASTNTVTGLSNMNGGSVGRRLSIAGSMAAHDNGSYRIAAVLSPSSVVLNASDTAAKATWANDNSASWSYSETAGPEADEVRCANVIGSDSASNQLTGDANDNWLTGGSGTDTLVGGAGHDTLMGFDANDALYGGSGDDSLFGGLGNDALHGGDGNDVLEGDDNADSFECDGKNDPTTLGSAPGGADFTVDYKPGAPDNDTRQSDCEF